MKQCSQIKTKQNYHCKQAQIAKTCQIKAHMAYGKFKFNYALAYTF